MSQAVLWVAIRGDLLTCKQRKEITRLSLPRLASGALLSREKCLGRLPWGRGAQLLAHCTGPNWLCWICKERTFSQVSRIGHSWSAVPCQAQRAQGHQLLIQTLKEFTSMPEG